MGYLTVGGGEVQKRRRKTHIAPVLGGGRFTQPGADGGECSTHHLWRYALQNGAADITGRRRSTRTLITFRPPPPRRRPCRWARRQQSPRRSGRHSGGPAPRS